MDNHGSLGFGGILLALALIAVLGFNLYLTYSLSPDSPATAAVTATSPSTPEVSITILQASTCERCANLSELPAGVESLGVKVLKTVSLLENTEEAKALITKYKITRVPSAIITGQLEPLKEFPLRSEGDALVFEDLPPPYLEVSTGTVRGAVIVIGLEDSTCAGCSNASSLISVLGTQNVWLDQETTLDAQTEEAKRLIAAYNITKIPTIILAGDAMEYPFIKQAWTQAGTQESDGRLVLRQVPPPYKDLVTNNIAGLVELTYITDKSCQECYDVTMHEQILSANFRMQFISKSSLDISDDEGKQLAQRYNITKVPTVIVSKEAAAYPGMLEVWAVAGSIASDGSFVFTNPGLVGGTYRDLSNGTIVNGTVEASA